MGMTTDSPRGKGPCSPFSGHSCLLNLQWLLITKVIETPVYGMGFTILLSEML